ncbi:polysaccharide export protein [Limisphaera ngatamarikiensis]|uniref:Polysaccharide export protein n=1 Tax=Limisphaera ngatamarikiensis TaxID=1324935 RepID=A0A6M1RPE9_9BACT|nr:polysaccharide biosynthesis/export family protein [Limisphaera ngatamarikiensis]NGO39533.1 polysaccharide export protein [Limisphaera ngatamarikiensis]
MSHAAQRSKGWHVLFCGLVLTWFLSGCGTPESERAAFPEPAVVGGGGGAPVAQPPALSTNRTEVMGAVEKFRIGDTVTVNFSGVDSPPPPHEERIKEDGTITLPMIGSVIAAGKTAGELQKELQERYSRYYTRLTVTVKSLERFYYVGGEVRSPGRYPWLGELTVTQAIQSAGDFTDFARKTRVLLVRANGQTEVVDCRKAIERPELDPKVMPGDRIHVPRRFW